jgi:phosphoenolpyruvate carboxykinase (ATP)
VEQAVYHFLSGYTAKVAGTEVGLKEPQATFSACFGAPFMALPPAVYAGLFMKKIRAHGAKCWLVNTGWAGKPYGEGERIKIAYSRAIAKSILNGSLEEAGFDQDPVFGLMIPRACEGVPKEILNPKAFAPNGSRHEERSKRLAADFKKNFEQFGKDVPKEILEVMP